MWILPGDYTLPAQRSAVVSMVVFLNLQGHKYGAIVHYPQQRVNIISTTGMNK